MQLPTPQPGDEVAHVAEHLLDLALEDEVVASPAFRGGQTAADAALAAFSGRGYASDRNRVWPQERRGASRLSPYIRHGLLPLRRVWDHVSDAPKKDREKLRDELLWQEYARHVGARLGPRMGQALRFGPPRRGAPPWPEPWPRDMACMALAAGDLERDGWVLNQMRMWLSSQWTVRAGFDWRDGERRMYQHLLDGSRWANRLGWQWTVGTAIGRPYGFARWQVEQRAPGLCDQCPLRLDCPIQQFPQVDDGPKLPPPAELRSDDDPARTGGPVGRVLDDDGAPPELVWLHGESLGDADPALAAHPGLPVVWVWDEPLLASARLSTKRLVFLAECLADLGTRRDLTVLRGDPSTLLAGRRVATTWTFVRGWQRRAAQLDVAALHPWPWLVRPHGGALGSYTAWRKATPKDARPEATETQDALF